ncbi:MAG: 6,7-dimethyl-8-ribityllumazine synthase [Deltaproteobacteria bacterium RIFCSPHIGHO2_12_FULL_43_9]|nr:MAG: 6,7-dimethyl-8-ribityllumazine synthase [Deltaproteobacteria bacterium RIFCSPHIGHO2_12_FULL_43_9]
MSIKIITGNEKPLSQRRIGVIVSRYNEDITTLLLDNALEELRKQDIPDENIIIVKVAGSWEIPYAARALMQHGEVDGVVTLGCLIKGETSHYEIIASTTAGAIQKIAEDFDMPITFGVLTCFTKAQAMARANGHVANMGKEATKALLQALTIQEQIKKNIFSQTTTLEQ